MERNSLISERYLLRGAPNARDLGGLPTMDGRKVRTGLLLRSGELAGITDADAHTLSQYPLRTVIDFRTDLEREQKPDRVLAGVRYIHCPIVQQAAAGLTREEQADPYGAVVAHAKTMAGKERAFMCAMYRSLVTHDYSIAHYRQFFAHLLAQTDGALLYHWLRGQGPRRRRHDAAADGAGRGLAGHRGKLSDHERAHGRHDRLPADGGQGL